MLGKRLKELLAVTMIGEGVVGLIEPKRYTLLWKFGPKPFQNMIETIAEHPTLTRISCGVEIGLGLCLALRQTSK